MLLYIQIQPLPFTTLPKLAHPHLHCFNHPHSYPIASHVHHLTEILHYLSNLFSTKQTYLILFFLTHSQLAISYPPRTHTSHVLYGHPKTQCRGRLAVRGGDDPPYSTEACARWKKVPPLRQRLLSKINRLLWHTSEAIYAYLKCYYILNTSYDYFTREEPNCSILLAYMRRSKPEGHWR